MNLLSYSLRSIDSPGSINLCYFLMWIDLTDLSVQRGISLREGSVWSVGVDLGAVGAPQATMKSSSPRPEIIRFAQSTHPIPFGNFQFLSLGHRPLCPKRHSLREGSVWSVGVDLGAVGAPQATMKSSSPRPAMVAAARPNKSSASQRCT